MSDNPLASRRARPASPEPDPMLRHAQIFAHVHSHPSEALTAHVNAMDGLLPMLGKLAGDPDVTAKDVIKAATSAVADGHMSPSKAVANIADMPADPDKLRVWLKERYADALAVTVHAKAALLARAQSAQPGVQPGTQPMGDGSLAVPQSTPAPMPSPPPGVTTQ